jgi:hypothetical protein
VKTALNSGLVNDFKLTRAVRVTLTRLRIDSAVVNIHCSRGELIISGALNYPYSLEGYRSDLSYELLHEMDRQLHQLEGIKSVHYVLDNWSHNSDGHWTKKIRKKKAA